ncbi:hypothetical protein DRQ53_07865 [bacterium]|nr:MAG: hypothetical protein DRQ53_07865 [bacterium]
MKKHAALLLLMILAGFGACSKTPDEPAFDNPFDPHGTNPGGGYGILAEARGSAVYLSWDNLVGATGYSVLWSSDSPDSADMIVVSPADSLIPPSAGLRVEFEHEGFVAEKTNWYRVVGRTEVLVDGDVLRTPMIASVAVGVDINLLVEAADGRTTTPTRLIEIDMLTGIADSVEIANSASFASSTVFDVMPGQTERVSWTLPTVAENRTDLWVHFRTRMQQSVGTADSFAIQALFTPNLVVERGVRIGVSGSFMVDTLQVFNILPVDGQSLVKVERRGYAQPDSSQFIEDVTPATVDDPVMVFWDPQSEVARDGAVIATLQSDFGFSAVDSVELGVPGAVGEPMLEIVGGAFTTTREIEVVNTAENAGYVLLSESPDFSGGSWVTFADTLAFQLEDVLGARFLYAAYSNPILAETVVTSTPVTLVSPPRR